jgi:hypothetical protein
VPRAPRLLVLRSHWLYVIFTIDHRDSITDRHGFVYKSAQATTAMSFIEMIIFSLACFPHHAGQHVDYLCVRLLTATRQQSCTSPIIPWA